MFGLIAAVHAGNRVPYTGCMCASRVAGDGCATRLGRPRIVFDPEPIPPSITPEMIEAGALILSEYGGLGPYTAKHLAEDAYRVMAALAPPKAQD